jgi:hypothetical protein
MRGAAAVEPAGATLYHRTANGAIRAPFRWARDITSFMLQRRCESPRLPRITVKG